MRPVAESGRAPASSGFPAIVRGAGAGWEIMRCLQPGVLAAYGDLEVMAEIEDEGERPVTLAEVLAALADHSRAVYARNLVVERWRPELLRLLPPELSELNWLTALPQEARPKWTWVMLGVAGTTTSTHVDTLYSAAWNLLVTGRKRWRFWPPAWSCRRGLIPELPPELAAVSAAGAVEGYETEQSPGDLIYTPTGWAHEVLNLESSISITGNYLNHGNIASAAALLSAAGEPATAALLRRLERRVGVLLPAASPADRAPDISQLAD